MESHNSPKSSLELHISADRPITGKSDDRLNRSAFAEAIARVIWQWRSKPSLVIGLFGNWGSGKSSVKNLVVEALRDKDGEKIPIVEFSPWQVSGQDILFDVFFREIGEALGKTCAADDSTKKKRISRWKLYSSVLSVAATVARAWKAAMNPVQPTTLSLLSVAASTTLDASAAVVKAGAEGIVSEAALETHSLSELKASITGDLGSLTAPILVILDDIDRLSKEEIRLVFQLVKANADFPNIIYLLLAQRATVAKALDEISPDNGEAFLEKIVQVSFDVPTLNRKQLQSFLFEGLNKLLTGEGLSARFDKTHWASVFPAIFPLFRNLRDLNRFLGSLAFHIEVFRNGDTFEVNPVDLIGLEVLRVFEPNVYSRLPQEKDALTLEQRRLRDKKREEDKHRIDNLVGLASNERRPVVSKLIAELFPPSGLSHGLYAQSDDQENRWFKELRVCSYQVFDRYFQLATPEGDVSQADIDELINQMSDQKALGGIFARLAERDLLETMLLRLHSLSLSEALPLDHASSFLAALFEIEIKERQYGFLETGPKARITGITYWYLHRMDERGRIDTLKKALNRTKGIGIAVDTTGLFANNTESKGSMELFVASDEGSEELKQACLAAIKRVTEESPLLSSNADLGFLGYWSVWDLDAATTWLSSYLRTRANVVHFLRSIVDTSSGTGGNKRYIMLSKLGSLISLDELKGRISTYLNGDFSEEESEILNLVRASFKRIDEGKVEDPFLILREDHS
jgi:predicted KAP-like P-loop ATPase